MNYSIAEKRVGIIGGGPGGLILARLLQQKGIPVTVYERDAGKEVRQQGATLDLHQDSGLLAMTKAGLLDAFKKNFRPGADKLRVVDEQGAIFHDDHTGKTEEAFDDDSFRPEIDRGPLRDMLIGSLQPGTIVWNSYFDRMEKQKEGWLLYFKNGTTAWADLVVAADGANSKVRSYLTTIRPVYSGITIIEGGIYQSEHNAKQLHALTKGGKVFALAHGKSIILSAKGDGSLSFYTGCMVPESWLADSGIDFSNKESVAQWFRHTFKDWGPIWLELVGSEQSYFIPRPMYHYPLDQSWSSLPDLTILGDAAHRMPPYAGEGVNMAMLDALELYECLTGGAYQDISQAIAGYEKGMRSRAAEITRLTLEQTAALHQPDGLQYLICMFNYTGEGS
jgi:2-polyprenyl-6-methoxyphenol hydroxylase-like FAD-dependent oxidoreductase